MGGKEREFGKGENYLTHILAEVEGRKKKRINEQRNGCYSHWGGERQRHSTIERECLL